MFFFWGGGGGYGDVDHDVTQFTQVRRHPIHRSVQTNRDNATSTLNASLHLIRVLTVQTGAWTLRIVFAQAVVVAVATRRNPKPSLKCLDSKVQHQD